MRRRNGLTIVEVLVVITVIGIVVAMLIPAIMGVKNSGLNYAIPQQENSSIKMIESGLIVERSDTGPLIFVRVVRVRGKDFVIFTGYNCIWGCPIQKEDKPSITHDPKGSGLAQLH